MNSNCLIYKKFLWEVWVTTECLIFVEVGKLLNNLLEMFHPAHKLWAIIFFLLKGEKREHQGGENESFLRIIPNSRDIQTFYHTRNCSINNIFSVLMKNNISRKVICHSQANARTKNVDENKSYIAIESHYSDLCNYF